MIRACTKTFLARRYGWQPIYLFGGGKLMDAFIKADAIEKYSIRIIPVILGSGKPLFYPGNPMLRLTLYKYSISEGIPIMHYIRN